MGDDTCAASALDDLWWQQYGGDEWSATYEHHAKQQRKSGRWCAGVIGRAGPKTEVIRIVGVAIAVPERSRLRSSSKL